MSQNEMKNVGYGIVHTACKSRCYNATRAAAAIAAYAAAINAHESVNHVLVQLIALNVIENS